MSKFINSEDKNIVGQEHEQKIDIVQELIIKDRLCVLFIISIICLFFMVFFFMWDDEPGYVSRAAIVLTSVSFISWLRIDNILAKNHYIKIFPGQFSEYLKNIITIVYLCLLYSEVFMENPSVYIWFNLGIMYIMINLLAYFVSIVKWK